jgi:hypothetical protein
MAVAGPVVGDQLLVLGANMLRLVDVAYILLAMLAREAALVLTGHRVVACSIEPGLSLQPFAYEGTL